MLKMENLENKKSEAENVNDPWFRQADTTTRNILLYSLSSYF